MWRTFVGVAAACLMPVIVGSLRAEEPNKAPQKGPAELQQKETTKPKDAAKSAYDAKPKTTARRQNTAKQNNAVELIVGEPIRHENLTIFPITSRLPRDADRFITLDEGLKRGTVEMRELGAAPAAHAAANAPVAFDTSTQSAADDAFGNSRAEGNAQGRGNDVNHLRVVNHSDKPLYLMPGEIIVGGSQDRTIAQEYVIGPGAKPVSIEVFCVEHGRWGSRATGDLAAITESLSMHDRRTGSAALVDGTAEQLARQANSGRFIGSAGSLNKSARIAVQESKKQQDVWDKVLKENSKSGVKAHSDAFTGQYAEEAAAQRLDPYLASLQKPVSEASQVVGIVVAVNGNVDSADVLESTPLFRKLWPKLLKSYALDAANAMKDSTAGKRCTRDEAVAFLTELQNVAMESAETKGNVALSKHTSDRMSAFSAFDKPGAAGAMGGMGGGFGGGIHSSGFSK